MAPSLNDDSPPSTIDEAFTENNLQPFFVLQKGSSRKSDGKSSGTGRTRRIDLSSASPKNSANIEDEKEDENMNLRMEAFEFVWSKIESTIKDVLRVINTNVFSKIQTWVHQSFDTIRSLGTPEFPEATQSFPIITDANSKRLFTGLVLTKNMEFVDDLLTFEELGKHLKYQGCHVANLSSLDFTPKNGVGGCLRSLLRQFLMSSLDPADISILASWYREENCNNPVVVIIDDIERCCGSVLSDFILMLSEWVIKIPVILIMGVATTLDAPRNILPSNALRCLCPFEFTLGTPAERMDAVVEAVLVKPCSGFIIGHKVAVFMRNYFVSQDGTLTSFIRALKIACTQHFYTEPLSVILLEFASEEDNLVLEIERHGLSPEVIWKHVFELPSCQRVKLNKPTSESLAHAFSELKRSQNQWRAVVLCLYVTGKGEKVRLLDLFCEAIDPESYNQGEFDTNMKAEKDPVLSSSQIKGHVICKAVRLVSLSSIRDLSTAQLGNLLKIWENLTVGIPEVIFAGSFSVLVLAFLLAPTFINGRELKIPGYSNRKINGKVKELLSLLNVEDGKSSKKDLTVTPRRHTSRIQLNIEKDSKSLSDKAANLIECMVRDYMHPTECIPFHEIFCFKDVDKLRLALIGDPRRRIQVDLLEFQKLLCCRCCTSSSNALLPSMHDTSIMYKLAQEHGDLINLHDWYQSFKSIVLCPNSKRKPRQSPLPKKRKGIKEGESQSEASIQARFCRAVTELQITGLLRMPSKRRPDFAQRVAFGL
ncbi:origin of replication complex subunit 3 isoform X1 [Gossypium australe]|uniref:Origin of replication complex subunit 3 isoform X1 n=1 Tax=Gossypium australe TaxID=47621 RepID=A0A5B6UKB3_9ROSI|nr:origin of replication complex subunit 3 isoform X1 [Gossypium australe]